MNCQLLQGHDDPEETRGWRRNTLGELGFSPQRSQSAADRYFKVTSQHDGMKDSNGKSEHLKKEPAPYGGN